ncbi:MFS transporter [Tepidimicrobium xylanilyticum]|uniref:Predicted arabinose efflux permease, MFS family n=1 Tax=Tepidimicrobium xylanilyticum TaxID=1123352 RepID=A0A1H2Z9H3_9FIRM|nr:MFS transporter [Tepidimicrobium xylanilyticum]GMG96422.1 MFS transporter [Tepidimicrobium xylanilyticum]SDX13986.1 Predicted arabinose efflux permease, MFS family [Tepidimicrobium xylanilyticum]
MDYLKALKKTAFYISFPFSIIGFFLPVYAYSIGISVMELGFIYSAFSLFTILMRPAVGLLIDKKGRKIGVVLGIFFYCLVNLFLFIGDDFIHLFAVRTFQGIASSFLWISMDTIISDISHEGNRSENFGIIDESLNRGDFLGAFIGFTIIFNNLFRNSFKAVFFLYLITSLISLFYAIFKIEETISLKKSYKENLASNNKSFNLFLILMGLTAFVSNLTGHIYLVYVRENITDKLYLISYLFIPGAILSMFLPNKLGKISDKYDRRKILSIGILMLGFLYLLIPSAKDYYYFMVINVLISIVSMFCEPAEYALVIDIVGENQRGKSYGKYKLALGLGGMLGPILGAFIYEQIGDIFVFYVKGLMLIGLSILTYKLLNKKAPLIETKNVRSTS